MSTVTPHAVTQAAGEAGAYTPIAEYGAAGRLQFVSTRGPADRARFEAHVADCPGCDAYLGQMRATLDLVGATAAVQTGPEVLALLKAFRGWNRPRSTESR
jgi:Putative zinc-finger